MHLFRTTGILIFPPYGSLSLYVDFLFLLSTNPLHLKMIKKFMEAIDVGLNLRGSFERGKELIKSHSVLQNIFVIILQIIFVLISKQAFV